MEYPKYVKRNDSDLMLAIRQGMRPMLTWYDPARRYLPYFYNYVEEERLGNSHHESYSAVHTMGRWWDALVNASFITGEAVPEEIYEHLRYWAFHIFDNQTGMPANLDLNTFEEVPLCDLHNLREAMYAFTSMIKRNPDDEQAKKMAVHLIQMVDTYADFDTGMWKTEQYEKERGGKVMCGASDSAEVYRFSSTLGRYIGALVRLYREWPLPEALSQAIRLTKTCFCVMLRQDGTFDADLFARHIHSTTSTISGVAMLGDLLHDSQILDRVRAFFENGFGQIALDFGWCLENAGRPDDLVGEINNTCDLMEACLCLGRAGYPEYYDMADRMIRGHVLPSQLLDVSWLPDEATQDPATDRFGSRMQGAFGFPCPYGHEYEPGSQMSFNWDIVGGGVSGLCQAYGHVVRYQEGIADVNLLFDREDPSLRFRSPYEHDGNAEIMVKRPLSARIRLHQGIREEPLSAALDRQKIRWDMSGGWLYLYDLPLHVPVRIPMTFDPVRIQYQFRDHRFHVRYEGNRITGMDSSGKRLCFFPDLTEDSPGVTGTKEEDYKEEERVL